MRGADTYTCFEYVYVDQRMRQRYGGVVAVVRERWWLRTMHGNIIHLH